MKILASILSLGLLCASTIAFAEIPDKDFESSFTKFVGTEKGQEVLGSAVETYFRKRQKLEEEKRQKAAKDETENQFKNPVQISVGTSPVRGNPNAKVTVIEFSDFQCPFCQRGAATMEELLKKYPNDVKLAFKHLPLGFHEHARPAAKAAMAAGKQGKFWEMHDAFFKNQGKLGKDYFTTVAKELGLNIEQFEKDMASPEIEKQIAEDEALAKKHGIEGTPGFFVNGVAVRGAYPISHFEKIVDRWLNGGAPAANG